MGKDKKLVIFVHGLGGGEDTWKQFISVIDSNSDSQGFDYKIFSYNTSLVRALPFCLLKGNSAIHNISNGLKTFIEVNGDEYDEVILVGHSLGGVIIKNFLVDYIHSGLKHKNVKKVIFYAVPHNGSFLANVSSLLSSALTLGICNVRQLLELNKESSFLDKLNDQWFRANPSQYFDITCVVANGDMIVSPASAKTECRYNLQTIEREGHISVINPKDSNDLSFKIFLKIIHKKKQPKFLNEYLIRKTNERAIFDAGRRFIVNESKYKDYNFEVGIEEYFSVLVTPNVFVDSLQNLVWEFIDSLNGLNRFIPDVESVKRTQDEYLGLEFVDDIFDFEYYKSVDLDFESEMRYEELVDLIHGKDRFTFENRQNAIDEVKECLTSWTESFEAAFALHSYNDPRHLSDTFYVDQSFISRSFNLLNQILELLDSKMARLFVRPFLLLSGEALIGKTHLFCDEVSNQLSEGKQSILFLGHVLSSEDQIEKQLLSRIPEFDYFDELLDDLNIIGDSESYRPTIFIDAINEAGANKVWFDQLQGFIEKVSNYPNVSLALSVRDVTKQDVISQPLYQSRLLTEIIHPGLSNCGSKVLSKICEIFSINMPEVPLLHNIDYNPGLLFLFFEGLQSKGITNIDFEMIRPSTIFDNLFEGINQNICKKLELDIRADHIKRCLNIVVAKMFESDERSLKYSQVYESVFQATRQEKLLSSLISEGVLNVFETGGIEKIFFTYQKFENYFVANFILERFRETGFSISEFGSFLEKDEYRKALDETMVLEALAVIIPDQYQEELPRVIKTKNNILKQNITSAFLQSLYWRSQNSFNMVTQLEIDKLLRLQRIDKSDLFDVSLKVAVVHNHPLNAFWLHKKLNNLNLSAINSIWNGYLLSSADNEAIQSTIDWVHKHANKVTNKTSINLFGLFLGWMLSDSNRKVRDTSTKALVNLYRDKIADFLELLKQFECVKDLYIKERLYAAGYGILLSTKLSPQDSCLAEYIYEIEFEHSIPTPHFLIREYARNIVKKTISALGVSKYNAARYEPPYESNFQLITPDIKILEKYKDLEGLSSIWSSLMYNHKGFVADFGNYIVNSCLRDISNIPISSSTVPKPFSDELDNGEVQKWIFNKIIRMGYDPQQHGKIDKKFRYFDRHEHKIERIGKKFQWLAFFEILARLSDIFKAIPEYDLQERDVIKGGYELFLRHIDPSYIDYDSLIQINNLIDSFSYEIASNNLESWVKDAEDFPDLKSIIEVTSEGKNYLVLDTFITKSEPGGRDWKTPRKQVHFSVHSLLVKQEDLDAVIATLKNEKIRGVDLFRNSGSGEVFLKEFFDSEAYEYVSSEYYGRQGWFNLASSNLLVSKTADQYFWDSSYDGSLGENNSVSKLIPSQTLYKVLNLEVDPYQSAVYASSSTSEIISNKLIDEKNNSLTSKPEIIELLAEKGLVIVWVGWYERNIIHCPEHIRGQWVEKNSLAFYELGSLKVEEY